MYKDHPDWVQYDMAGAANVFYGSVVFWVPPGAESAWMCPNSGYRDYIYARVAQIAATGVDGLWMDVPLLNDIVLQWTDTNPAAVAAFLADTGPGGPDNSGLVEFDISQLGCLAASADRRLPDRHESSWLRQSTRFPHFRRNRHHGLQRRDRHRAGWLDPEK